MSAIARPHLSLEQINQQGGASPEAAAQASAILKGRKTTELMELYREAKRTGTTEASEARRWITAELIDRIGREATIAFQERAHNEAKEVTIETRQARAGDIYVTRENHLYTRHRITHTKPCHHGTRVELKLADNTTRVLGISESIVVERNSSGPPSPHATQRN